MTPPSSWHFVGAVLLVASTCAGAQSATGTNPGSDTTKVKRAPPAQPQGATRKQPEPTGGGNKALITEMDKKKAAERSEQQAIAKRQAEAEKVNSNAAKAADKVNQVQRSTAIK